MDPTTNLIFATLLGVALGLSIVSVLVSFFLAGEVRRRGSSRAPSLRDPRSMGEALHNLCTILNDQQPGWAKAEIERDGDNSARVNIEVEGGKSFSVKPNGIANL